jgi:2-oxoglutarate ferredoxin oxidoreductase subunit beta
VSYLNSDRPPLFCPGCSHQLVVKKLDQALIKLGLPRQRIVIVTDIGCAGLFDTFFHTHAFHGLHGRALTYATGLKMTRPELTVVVIMGDGGLGIGGAHLLASCRRNLDITLLVLNNFNYGMTGGQCSATTPPQANTSSGLLNQLEPSLDICRVAEAAGAPFVDRILAADKDLAEQITEAMAFGGFSLLDIWGICPGRYLKRNRLNLKQLDLELRAQPPTVSTVARKAKHGSQPAGLLPEYGSNYRAVAAKTEVPPPLLQVECSYRPLITGRCEILILGAAGQYINTLGEILCLAAVTSGLHTTQKNDYPITVLRGHSISEVVMDLEPIHYTGLSRPSLILCVAEEGISRREKIFANLDQNTLIIADSNLRLPQSSARAMRLDCQKSGISVGDRGLALLALLAQTNTIINDNMLRAAISLRYSGQRYQQAISTLNNIQSTAK